MDYQGFAKGWFAVAFSTELAATDVRPLRYFGKDLVMFRGEDNQVRILDAHCPHMGAHLGHGGRVENNTIRCPFHAWRFAGDGSCVDVPYAKKIPPKATTTCWSVIERNGVILVHHDASGALPTYDIPVIPEYGTSDWLPWQTHLFAMKTHPREIIENIGDRAHFLPVHKTIIDEFAFERDGHMATQIARGRAIYGDTFEHYSNVTTYHGPGYMVTHMKGSLQTLLLVMSTPIEENSLHLRFAMSLKNTNARNYMAHYMQTLKDGFLQDQHIWENKVFRERAVLCDGDGPIGKVRQWYRQFY